jgi:PAS domain S-box-containing protein
MVHAQATEGSYFSSPIRLSSSTLNAFLEISPDALILINQTGTIVLVNQQAEVLFGYSRTQLLDQPLEQLLPERFRGSHCEHRTRYFSTPYSRPMGAGLSLFGLRQDGTEFPVNISLKPLLLETRLVALASIRDMSIQRKMEGELARRGEEREQIIYKLERINQQLHGLFEHAPAGLALFDARPPYQVLLHNTIYQEFFPEPFHSEGMLGKYLPEYVPQAEEDGISGVFHEVESTRQGVTRFSFVYDGMPRGRTWWNWHLAPVIKDGEIAAFAMTVIEATQEVLARQQLETELAERKQAEDALRQSRDELVAVNVALEQANLVRSQFLATMSHELRTPLTSITGFGEMLLEDAKDGNWSPQQQNSLERILTNSEHLLGLINDVLDLSKIEAGQMVLNYSWVDVRSLLSEVAAEIGSLVIKRNLFLKTEVQKDLVSLETNPGKLHQILLNLVSNALKFTEHGGVVLSATQAFLSDQKTKGIAFAVKDTGIGIPADNQEQIFEPFYQADMSYTRKVGGTGLGLSIVSQLTALLGGTITVESAPGQGSTFTVTLPIEATSPLIGRDLPRLHPGSYGNVLTTPAGIDAPLLTSSSEMSEQREAINGQHHVILAVDDNADALALLKHALRDMLYTVVGVQDPLTVIEQVQIIHPSIITLDVMMLHCNGWQLLHQLKDNPATASIPVVMLTALSEQMIGYVLGADGYVSKPYSKEVLCQTIHHLLEATKGH